MTDAVFLENFKNILSRSHSSIVAYKISEVADSFIRGQEQDEKILDLLVDVFLKLDKSVEESKSNLIYQYFFWNFVSTLGYNPELTNCINCQKKLNPYEIYFSSSEGGVICKNCYALKREGIKIKSDSVKVLRLILKRDWDILSKIKMSETLKNSLVNLAENYYLNLCSVLKSNFKNV